MFAIHKIEAYRNNRFIKIIYFFSKHFVTFATLSSNMIHAPIYFHQAYIIHLTEYGWIKHRLDVMHVRDISNKKNLFLAIIRISYIF